MSFIQKLLIAVLPDARRNLMEAELREWMLPVRASMLARCGDLGGVRWKAAGNPGSSHEVSKLRQGDLARDFKEPADAR
jgi:hypothetical protein